MGGRSDRAREGSIPYGSRCGVVHGADVRIADGLADRPLQRASGLDRGRGGGSAVLGPGDALRLELLDSVAQIGLGDQVTTAERCRRRGVDDRAADVASGDLLDRGEVRGRDVGGQGVGSGLARVELELEQLMILIIDTFLASSRSERHTPELRIVVRPGDLHAIRISEVARFVEALDHHGQAPGDLRGPLLDSATFTAKGHARS
ncbi:macro domain-containing protein [Streptomyces parvus]|uniref:macro domain-containing protein n=1 Tax=Streptomyces parvus TaxID=66428 RepID=UPI0035E1E0F5